MNLSDYPQVRKILYLVQWLYNGVLVLAGAVLTVQQKNVEDAWQWYLYAAALGPVLWTYLGMTAQTNVREDPAPPGA